VWVTVASKECVTLAPVKQEDLRPVPCLVPAHDLPNAPPALHGKIVKAPRALARGDRFDEVAEGADLDVAVDPHAHGVPFQPRRSYQPRNQPREVRGGGSGAEFDVGGCCFHRRAWPPSMPAGDAELEFFVRPRRAWPPRRRRPRTPPA